MLFYCRLTAPETRTEYNALHLLRNNKPSAFGGKTVTDRKMVDNKIAKELLDKIDVFEHTRVARHIPRSAEISLKYFENSGLSCKYFLDLDKVFIKTKRKVLKFHTPDPDHVYDIFGKYSREEANVVRTSVIDYITCDPISFRE